ncbi:MAG: sensor domain-containing phosphodiesterase [Ruminococcus sp.]|nr:sensor domain-containing phosphodiesterase [Ruminococcus sp.]
MKTNNAYSGYTLSDSDCLNVIKFTLDSFENSSLEIAMQSIAEQIFSLTDFLCIRVREVDSLPCSLICSFEQYSDSSLPDNDVKTKIIDEKIWSSLVSGICRVSINDDNFLDYIGDTVENAGSLLTLPLTDRNDFLGILDVISTDEEHEWGDNEISVFEVIAKLLSQQLGIGSKDKASEDSLTGLMDYSSFVILLNQLIYSSSPDLYFAIVYTDIHHFKYINEMYGYEKGNEVLKVTANYFAQGSGEIPGFMISRVHSDNFVTASIIDKDFIEKFDSFIFDSNIKLSEQLHEICPNVSARLNTGICFIKSRSIAAETAIAHANLARKLAKSENRRRPNVFSDKMMEDIRYQEYLNSELPSAIRNHNLKVYYQPKINCADDSLYGAEALVRWQRDDGTFIYPDQFIPLFEKNGNIIEVDFYVYREVFKYLKRRLDEGLPMIPISMNVSRVHLRSNRIIPYIKALLDEYKIPPEYLEFELTENIYIKNFEKANEFINACREMGIKVSMDDFGSGYSSLNVMSTLSIDTLKIDRVFLKNDELNANDKTVLESIITMAKKLGMSVLCEGVETKSQSLFLKETSCDIIQGFYYGKSMDEKTFDKYAQSKLEA